MKRKIINGFAHIHSDDKELNCFGCSPNNQLGLKLEFYDLGDEIETLWNPETHFEGFTNVLHGGLQATLQDEIAGWVVFTKCETSGVTKNMNIKYLHPVFLSDGDIRVTAKLIEKQKRSAFIETKLFNGEGKLCSEAEIEYFVFPLAVAKRKHYYPGVEAFYEKE